MKDIWKYIIPVLAGIAIGLLLYNPLFKPSPVIVTVTPDSTSQTSIPDTIYEIKIAERTVFRTEYVYHDTGRVDTVYKVESVIPFQHTYVSGKRFIHSKYNKTDVWSYASVPVDSFKVDNVVRWNKYYEDNVLPVYEMKLKSENKNWFLKGAGSVALIGLGIATKNPYVIGGSVLAAGGIVIFL